MHFRAVLRGPQEEGSVPLDCQGTSPLSRHMRNLRQRKAHGIPNASPPPLLPQAWLLLLPSSTTVTFQPSPPLPVCRHPLAHQPSSTCPIYTPWQSSSSQATISRGLAHVSLSTPLSTSTRTTRWAQPSHCQSGSYMHPGKPTAGESLVAGRPRIVTPVVAAPQGDVRAGVRDSQGAQEDEALL